jgi:hypothetical protein
MLPQLKKKGMSNISANILNQLAACSEKIAMEFL